MSDASLTPPGSTPIAESSATSQQSITTGEVRRQLLSLAGDGFTGCLNLVGPTSGTICLHEGSVWHARRTDQIHILSWLRTIGVLQPQDLAEWETNHPEATLREAAAKDSNVDLSVVESRVFDYVSGEVEAILGADAGEISLAPGDVTNNCFVAAWSVRHLMQSIHERGQTRDAPRHKLVGSTTGEAAEDDLRDLGMIVEP